MNLECNDPIFTHWTIRFCNVSNVYISYFSSYNSKRTKNKTLLFETSENTVGQPLTHAEYGITLQVYIYYTSVLTSLNQTTLNHNFATANWLNKIC